MEVLFSHVSSLYTNQTILQWEGVFYQEPQIVEIVKTSIFSKIGVATCVAKQHAYECGQSHFTSYKVPLEVNLI
jgi:uncharacterized protein involved in tolerance to divalent cations